MKKTIWFFVATLVLAGLSLTGCKEKKAPADTTGVQVVNGFSKQDTARVFELVEQFTARLQARDIQGAVDMLVTLNNDTLEQLTPANMQRQAIALRHLVGLPKYELSRVVMNNNTTNEAKIDITLFEKPEGDPRPNKTSFYLRPVFYQGQWYLTTKDNITDTDKDDPIQHAVDAQAEAQAEAEAEAEAAE